MPQPLLESPWLVAALVLAVLGAALLLAAIVALVTLSPIKFVTRTLGGLVFIAFGAAAGLVGVGTLGYESLAREELAARLSVKPTGPQRFSATIRFADGRTRTFELAGDEIAVDAHILKWHPWASLLGLRTAYQLDRITGRYRETEKERFAPRTVHPLADEGWVNLFRLRQHVEWLRPVVDAQYGSAAFTPADRPVELELLVSASGLLMREAGRARPQ
jgi:hypothetical protein